MLQRVSGLVILALGVALFTHQVMVGAESSVLLIFLSITVPVFGVVVNLQAGKEKPRERL